MSTTFEEAVEFVTQAQNSKTYQEWKKGATKSWDELKKSRKGNRLNYLGANLNRKKQKYPAWYSINQIRKPLLLSRVGIPIGRDTTQDGIDDVGSTAALLLERLAINLAKEQKDFFDVLCACRDDFLATCFALPRVYYEREEIKEKQKEYLQVEKTKDGPQFVDSQGQIFSGPEVYQDEQGSFIYTNVLVDVDREKVCVEPMLFKDVLIDPGIKRWSRCMRLGFKLYYSPAEYKKRFGNQAYLDLMGSMQRQALDTEKIQEVEVIEYWDKYDKAVYYWATNGDKFITPKNDYPTEEIDEQDAYAEEDENGIYDLDDFFPCPPPLMINAPTDDFWPITEYFQYQEIIENIHTLFSRMVAVARSLRAVLLYDKNVTGLASALNEGRDGDTFGVPNLAQALSGVGGDLSRAAQYVNIQPLVESFDKLFQALMQMLDMLSRLSGTNDLLQSQSNDNSGKTLGERQMEEKYAMNQIAESQRKVQELVRDVYQIMTELALKNFKSSSLERYFIPATLPKDHQQRYQAAVGLLKEDSRRFRIELETDSTIAINEQYAQQQADALVNIIVEGVTQAAQVEDNSPELVPIILHALKFRVQQQRQGKLFQAEITQALDAQIKATQEAAKNKAPEFNKDAADAQIASQKNQIDETKNQMTNQVEMTRIQVDMQLETEKIQSNERIKTSELQLRMAELQATSSNDQAELQLRYAELSATIEEAKEKLDTDRNALLVELRKITGEQEVEQFRATIEKQAIDTEAALGALSQKLQEAQLGITARQKAVEEARLNKELELETARAHVDMGATIHDATMSKVETNKPDVQEAPKQGNLHISIHAPKEHLGREKAKVKERTKK